MSWQWDDLTRDVSPNDVCGSEGMSLIYDEIFEEMYAPKRRSRWSWGERGWALLILAVLAATVALALLTPGAHQ